jgi:hypothetical protein
MRSLNAPNNGQQIHQLFDGQTDELLARVTFSNEGYLVAGVVEDSKHKLPEITDKWPETLVEANRRAEKRQRIDGFRTPSIISTSAWAAKSSIHCKRLPREIRVLWPAPSSVVSGEEVAASGHAP